MATYNLDVAFSSDVTPNDSTLPVAMAYGFTNDKDAPGIFKGKGQTKETLPPNSTVYFYVYDTAASPASVTSVQVSAVNKAPGQGTAKSPFTPDWTNGSIIAVSNPNGSQVQLSGPNGPNPLAQSTGCNVKGTSWGIGPFTVANLSGQQKFEITITVLTQTGQGQKSFIVDPEMLVGSEGK